MVRLAGLSPAQVAALPDEARTSYEAGQPVYGALLDQTWRVLTKIVSRYLYGPVLGPLFHVLVDDTSRHLPWPDPDALMA